MQGGYFIVNGSEKVLIAQERMASNHVAVYKKSQPSKYSYVAEMRRVPVFSLLLVSQHSRSTAIAVSQGPIARFRVVCCSLGNLLRLIHQLTEHLIPRSIHRAFCLACRSVLENSTRNTSSISVRMLAKSAAKGGAGQCIRATLPYIRSDVPIIIIFRALGFVVRTLRHVKVTVKAAVAMFWGATRPATLCCKERDQLDGSCRLTWQARVQKWWLNIYTTCSMCVAFVRPVVNALPFLKPDVSQPLE